MTDVALEAYVIEPANVYDTAIASSVQGNMSARHVIQALAASLMAIRRRPKKCMLNCGRQISDVRGEKAPAAFCILVPMFPFQGPGTDRAWSSPICRDCFAQADFIARLKEILLTDYGCSVVSDARKQ